MRKKILIFVFCVALSGFSIYPTIASSFPKELENVVITLSDLPAGFHSGVQSTTNDSRGAGWLTNNHRGTDTPIQGLRQGFSCGAITWSFKLGFFPSSQQAREGAPTAILTESTLYINKRVPGSFSGNSFGDTCFYWDFNLEPFELRQSVSGGLRKKLLSFSKGRYAVLVSGFSQSEEIDQGLLEQLAKKTETKIDVAIALDGFDSQLPLQIQHQGIRQSLQAKLDVFTKNYQKGKYKTALNNINAFINELNAQRGKHVSESAYQMLKAYADTIVLSLNALM